jgi:hypothetical protein
MKAAVKKKKLKNKKKKEKSLPNLFSGQGKKISDPRGKTPGSKISGSWGDETFRVRGSVPLAWELTLCDQFSLSANTAPAPPPPHPALNDPEKRPLCDQGTPLRHSSLGDCNTLLRARNCNSDAATRDRSSLSVFAFDH